MANMSYCRFENTVKDLYDCSKNMDDTDLSETEEKARLRLIRICKEIAEDYGWETEKM